MRILNVILNADVHKLRMEKKQWKEKQNVQQQIEN